MAKFIIRSRINESSAYKVEALVLKEITSYKAKCDKTTLDWSHLNGLPLADPNCSSNAPIDLLLGVDVYQLIIQRGLQKSKFKGPMGQKTTLGWILTFSSSAFRTCASSLHVALNSE